jgi:hypothetical protein
VYTVWILWTKVSEMMHISALAEQSRTAQGFNTLLRTAHNFALMNCLFLNFPYIFTLQKRKTDNQFLWRNCRKGKQIINPSGADISP